MKKRVTSWLCALADDAPPEGEKLYRYFIWNNETHRFEEER